MRDYLHRVFTGKLYLKALIVYVVGFVLMFSALVVGVTYAVERDSHQQGQWCATLELLTKTPVPRPANPEANPSRVFAYNLYTDFTHLKERFGCSK